MLDVRQVNTYYGDSHVLHDLSLRVTGGEVVAVLGRNGVGKSTLIRSIVGFNPPRSGEVLLDGQRISGLAPYEIVRRGVALVPQGRRMFASLTVRETLGIGRLASRFDDEHRGWDLDRVFTAFPRLRERLNTRTGRLSGGEQQMVAVSRALLGYPKLLLLDEPSEGLSPMVVDQLEGIFTELKTHGVTMLLVEQQVAFALRLADRVLVMSKGRFVYEGTPADVLADAGVRERYLGL
ncbi:MAG: ABC transporter ATP-binding protein [Burkholderiales bacterium]|nr:ABC transporter ATP-binding protein [Burkholderiales bacterium]